MKTSFTILAVLIFVFLLAWFLVDVVQKRGQRVAVPEQEEVAEENPEAGVSYWEELVSEVTPAIETALEIPEGMQTHAVVILEETDLTGDDVPEALVNTGTGGATMDQLSIVMLVDGEPKVVEIKYPEGQIENFAGMVGSGGAGRYGGTIRLLPEVNSFSHSFYSIYDTPDDVCKVDVFTWDSEENLFVYNGELSEVETQELSVTCLSILESMQASG